MDRFSSSRNRIRRLAFPARDALASRFRYVDRRFQEFWAATVGGSGAGLPGIKLGVLAAFNGVFSLLTRLAAEYQGRSLSFTRFPC